MRSSHAGQSAREGTERVGRSVVAPRPTPTAGRPRRLRHASLLESRRRGPTGVSPAAVPAPRSRRATPDEPFRERRSAPMRILELRRLVRERDQHERLTRRRIFEAHATREAGLAVGDAPLAAPRLQLRIGKCKEWCKLVPGQRKNLKVHQDLHADIVRGGESDTGDSRQHSGSCRQISGASAGSGSCDRDPRRRSSSGASEDRNRRLVRARRTRAQEAARRWGASGSRPGGTHGRGSRRLVGSRVPERAIINHTSLSLPPPLREFGQAPDSPRPSVWSALCRSVPRRSDRHLPIRRPKNRLLVVPPRADFARLRPHLRTVPITVRQILHPRNEPIREIYFPNGGVASVTAVMRNGVNGRDRDHR